MSVFVAVKTRVKASRERKSPDVEDVTIGEGCFWYVKPKVKIDPKTNRRFFYGINQKEVQRLKELVKSNFFTPQMLCTIANMNEESGSKKQTRLRSFDWAVTNFTKGNPISYLRPVDRKIDDQGIDKSSENKEIKNGNDTKKMIVDPHVSYSSELHSGHRLLFDPFRRGTHVYFEADGKNRHSTVGQLCFLKWCFDNGIDKYVDENADEIKKDMAIISKKRRKNRIMTGSSALGGISTKGKKRTRRLLDVVDVDDEVEDLKKGQMNGLKDAETDIESNDAKNINSCNHGNMKKRARMELTPTPKSRIRGLVPMTKIEIHA